MPPHKSPRYSVPSNIAFFLRESVKACAPLAFCLPVGMILGCVEPVLSAFLPKLIIECVTNNKSAGETFFAFGVYFLLLFASSILYSFVGVAQNTYRNELNNHFLKRLYYKTLVVPFHDLEDARFHRDYHKARRTLLSGESCASTILFVTAGLVTSFFCVVVFSGILATLSPFVMAFLAFFSLINYAALSQAVAYEQGKRDELSECDKKLFSLETICGDTANGKDVRLYSLSDPLLALWRDVLSQYLDVVRAIQNRNLTSSVLCAFTLLLRDGAAYGYLIWRVSGGQISVADFSLYMGAIAGFSVFVNTICTGVIRLRRASLQADDLRGFLAEAAGSAEPDGALPAPDRIETIEFRDVCFSYGGQAKPLIQNLNATIRGGETVALAGANGAGKTTLLKLLCGLYRPQSGRVLINGVDAARFSDAERYALFSVVFQDSATFPFSIAENISLKEEKQTDVARVWECLESAGLAEEVSPLERGVSAQLGKDIDKDGVVLSGGQRQKLLFARALYKDAPCLLLDEPASFMDPQADRKFIQTLLEASKGKTTILITHRLACARFFDKVLFMQNGLPVEFGTHPELISYGGAYAELFTTQTQRG